MKEQAYRSEECTRAARRGAEFVRRFARRPRHFADHGSDFLNYFYGIANSAADTSLRRWGREVGSEMARRWRELHPAVPTDADAEVVYDLVYGSLHADLFGFRDPRLKKELRAAARRFSATDFLGFDPAEELPPSDVTDYCRCGVLNRRGRKTCSACRRRLSFWGRYLVWYVALIRTYMAGRYGVSLGASYADVLRQLNALRPYPSERSDEEFWDAAYAVTHVVYTLNDYDVYSLRPEWLPQEFSFIKRHTAGLVADEDAETVGEFLSCLKCFGLGGRSPLVRAATDLLLALQNADGSWGETDTGDSYADYHTTLVAAAGLMEIRWRAQRLAFPEAASLLK
ncbi:MAG: hypothetical protein JOZ96_15070 [Acidobacteria bacterium]|nr:hypothetical protein [Acidobacteriota bacterium]